MAQFEFVKVSEVDCTLIYVAFKLHMEWSNAQCISIPTNTILPTTVSTFHSLNWVGHMIYTHHQVAYIKKL